MENREKKKLVEKSIDYLDLLSGYKSYILIFLVFLLPIFVLEVLFYVLTKSEVQKNLLYIIVNDISIALILTFLYLILKKIGYIISQIIILLFALYFVTEIVMYNTYNVMMPIPSMFSNVQNVTEHYGGELVEVIIHNLPLCIFVIAFYVLYVLTSSKLLNLIDENEIRNNTNNSEKFNINLLFIILGITLLVGSKSLVELTGDYSLDAFRFGLKTALYNDIKPDDKKLIVTNRNNYQIEEDEYTKKYNAFNIDFKKLNETAPDESFKNINSYVASLPPTEKNEYTGLFKGKNLILICAEAYSSYVLDKELTPTLYRLTNNGFKFTDYYVPSWGGSTTSGEFAFLTGLVANRAADTMKNTIGKNMCFTMPRVLKREGYNTGAFHNGNYKYYDRHLTHRANMGFDYFYATGNGLEDITETWPTDLQMIEDTFKTYYDKGPFCMYYMTLSGHAFYNDDTSFKVTKSIEKVKERYGDKYPGQVMNYICYQIYLEEALARLVELLEEKNITNDTVICLTADHFPYGLNSAAFTEGINYIPFLYQKMEMDEFDLDYNMPILWSGCLENEYKDMVKEIKEPTSTLDLLPTLLNLFGANYDSRLLPGRDVFSDAESYVIYNNGAFKTNRGKYLPSKMRFIPNDENDNDKAYVDLCKEIIKNKMLYSGFVVDYDYYNYLFTNENVPEDVQKKMATENITLPVILQNKTKEGYINYFKECNKKFLENHENIKNARTEKKKVMYLTFDDGPNLYANKIMDVLKENDIKGTFFIGRTDKSKVIKRMKSEGHTVAIHTASHYYSYIYESVENYLADLYEIQNSLYIATGEYIHILRFPGGSRNAISNEVHYGIMDELRPLVEELGFEYYDWHIASGDSSDKITPEEIVERVKLGLTNNYNESIILMHDLNESTVEALKEIIKYGKEEGYTFEKITDDTIPHHR